MTNRPLSLSAFYNGPNDYNLVGFRISKKKPSPLKMKWKVKACGERGSNTRPSDLQSDALPTELSPQLCRRSGKYLTDP